MEPVTPPSTGIVLERTRAGTLPSAVGDEHGVRLGSLGAGEAAPVRLGLLPRLAAVGDGDALGGLSAFTFLADLGEPAAAPLTFLFLALLVSSSPLTASGELIAFCDKAAADVLTVSAGFLSPFILLVCSLMNCSRQPQSNIRCSAARLVRQRYSKAENVASLSSEGVGSDVVTLIDSSEGVEAEAAELDEAAEEGVASWGVAVMAAVLAVAEDGVQQADVQGTAEAAEGAAVAAVGVVAVTGALIHEADVTGMGVE